jgi:hypothetical protein
MIRPAYEMHFDIPIPESGKNRMDRICRMNRNLRPAVVTAGISVEERMTKRFGQIMSARPGALFFVRNVNVRTTAGPQNQTRQNPKKEQFNVSP